MLYQDWDLVLNGQNLRITPLTRDDEEPHGRLLLGYFYDSVQEITQKKPSTGINEILDHTSSEETHALRPLDSNEFIGWIVLQRDKAGRPEIGISLIPDKRNKGYGPEAVQLFANYLYEKYGLTEVYVRISSENVQSQKAFSKVGAILDCETMDDRFASIIESYGDRPSPYDKVLMMKCYHIPLPIAHFSSVPAESHNTGTNQDFPEDHPEETEDADWKQM